MAGRQCLISALRGVRSSTKALHFQLLSRDSLAAGRALHQSRRLQKETPPTPPPSTSPADTPIPTTITSPPTSPPPTGASASEETSKPVETTAPDSIPTPEPASRPVDVTSSSEAVASPQDNTPSPPEVNSPDSVPTLRSQDATPAALGSPSIETLPAVPDNAPNIKKLAAKLRQQSRTRETTDIYAAFGTTEGLFKACEAPGDYSASPPTSSEPSIPENPSAASPSPIEALAAGTASKTKSPGPPVGKTATGEEIYYPGSNKTWHAQYSLPPSFSTWAHLTILHLYLALTRIRQLPTAALARRYEQQLLDHFFYAAEERMETLHGLTSKSIRGRFLKDLFDQYRGAVVGYDEGLLKGDAVLAAAVWRNLFRARDDFDALALAEVVSWVRRGARGLAKLSDADFAAAKWTFGVPWDGRAFVEKQSLGLMAGFGDEAGADGRPSGAEAAGTRAAATDAAATKTTANKAAAQ